MVLLQNFIVQKVPDCIQTPLNQHTVSSRGLINYQIKGGAHNN